MLYRPIAVEPPPGKPPAPSELSRLPIPTTTSLALEFEPVPLLTSLTLSLPKMTLRSEEHTSELQSLMRISYAVFCLKKKTNKIEKTIHCVNTIITACTHKRSVKIL